VKYRVVVTPVGQADIREAFSYIFKREPENARRWLRALDSKIASLETFPERFGPARERRYLKEDLRQLIFKSHRVVFMVQKHEKCVYVLHVLHVGRRAIGEPPASDERLNH
jgi:plasmid stabilization system protein ParE